MLTEPFGLELEPARPKQPERAGTGLAAPAAAALADQGSGRSARQLRRGPRPEEIALMRSLLDGPRSVTAGPIGRCVKRGWCHAVMVDLPKSASRRVCVVYALTEAGRQLVTAHGAAPRADIS